jgi:hypothetical protein
MHRLPPPAAKPASPRDRGVRAPGILHLLLDAAGEPGRKTKERLNKSVVDFLPLSGLCA